MPISTTLRRLDNNLYINADGLQTDADGIPLLGATVAGTQVYSYDGDPQGNLEVTGVAICIGKGSTAGGLWSKTTAGTSENEWTALINP